MREAIEQERRRPSPGTPAGPAEDAANGACSHLNILLADMFALYLKTKNFHWHVSGPHFRDYHLLFDEQADQIFATTDAIAERVRKLGGNTVRSIGQVSRLQRLADNDANYVAPLDMLRELRDDNRQLATRLREAHEVCERYRDFASASCIENWIDEAERRVWFLLESSRVDDESGGSFIPG